MVFLQVSELDLFESQGAKETEFAWKNRIPAAGWNEWLFIMLASDTEPCPHCSVDSED